MAKNNEPVYAEIDLDVYSLRPGVYQVELRATDPGNENPVAPARGLAAFDLAALQALQDAPQDYGSALAGMVFQDERIRNLYIAAKAAFDRADYAVRIRVAIDDTCSALHAVRWELLCDPVTNRALSCSERVVLSRFISGDNWRVVKLRSKSELNSVIAVAAPKDWAKRSMAEVDKAGETQRAKDALGLPNCLIAAEDDAPLTRSSLIAALRPGIDILYLVCHGMKPKDAEPCLFLQDADGNTERVMASKIAESIQDLPQPPRLVVLASCESALATDAAFEAHPALAPMLAAAGVQAVIAMQGKISMDSVKLAMPVFFKELMLDGMIDRAMAAARGEIRGRSDAWMPALFLRLKSGRIWYEASFTGSEDKLKTWSAITRNIRSGKCIPILGPDLGEHIFGASAEVARRLADRKKLPLDVHAASDLAKVTQYIAMDEKRGGAVDTLRETYARSLALNAGMEVADSDEEFTEPVEMEQFEALLDDAVGRVLQNPDDPYRILADLPVKMYVNASPETLLHRALQSGGKNPERLTCAWRDNPVQPKPAVDPTPDARCVYHVFGTFEEDDSLVLTEDDFFDYLIATSTYKLMPGVVASSLVQSSLLFLGFRLDDWTFRVLFRMIMALEGNDKLRQLTHVGVQVSPDDYSLAEVQRAREYLGKYFVRDFSVRAEPSINVYWGSSADFLRELRDHMPAAPAVKPLVKAAAAPAGAQVWDK